MKTHNVSNVSFGSASKLGKAILNNKYFNGFVRNTEYKGFTMSMPVTLSLLYGATLIPRLLNAYDKHDRREIFTRDLTSMTAILFFAKSLERGFSKAFTKTSGFVLNFTPKNSKNIFKKLANYLHPTKGIEVLNSSQITAKYSNLEYYKEGLAGFAKFIKEEGGDLKKVLSFNKNVKSHTEKLLGKDLKSSTVDEIIDKFTKTKKEDLQPIYNEFSNTKNMYVQKAKKMNSLFNFTSMFLIVPSFMIWLQKFNEKNTKRIINAELEIKKQQEQDKLSNNGKFIDKVSVRSGAFTSLRQ